MPRSRPVLLVVAVVTALVATLAGCGSSPSLTIYSGRNEQLVGPLLAELEQAVGGTVEVRYGDSAELAAQLLEEGQGTAADVFFSQDSGALGALSTQQRLAPLPAPVLDTVPAGFRADDGTWVGTSGRSRVIFYDPRQVQDRDVPRTLDDVVDPRWRGKVGYPPNNASWQTFVTAIRVIRGEDGARAWLQRFAANQPVRFENNITLLDAVDSGQVALGLSNHYYWYERVAERGAAAVTARVRYVPGGDPLGLVNVAGAGILAGTDAPDPARRAVEFLLSDRAQRYFADTTAEYPTRPGITSTTNKLPPLESLQPPKIDLSDLASLQQTLALLQSTGVA